MKGHEIVGESFQDNEHDASDYHLIHVVHIFDPNVLEPNDVLPTPFDAKVLISMKKIQGYLIDQLKSDVKENVRLKPILKHFLESKVLLMGSKELVILKDHNHADNDISKGEETSRKYSKKQCYNDGHLMKVHKQ